MTHSPRYNLQQLPIFYSIKSIDFLTTLIYLIYYLLPNIHTLKPAIVTWLRHDSYPERTQFSVTIIVPSSQHSFVVTLIMGNRLVPWLDYKCFLVRGHDLYFLYYIIFPLTLFLALVFVCKDTHVNWFNKIVKIY